MTIYILFLSRYSLNSFAPSFELTIYSSTPLKNISNFDCSTLFIDLILSTFTIYDL